MEEFASEDAGDAMAKAETESFDPRLALMALMALKDTRATNCLSLENCLSPENWKIGVPAEPQSNINIV